MSWREGVEFYFRWKNCSSHAHHSAFSEMNLLKIICVGNKGKYLQAFRFCTSQKMIFQFPF